MRYSDFMQPTSPILSEWGIHSLVSAKKVTSKLYYINNMYCMVFQEIISKISLFYCDYRKFTTRVGHPFFAFFKLPGF